jgi:hypothetical protein
VQGAGEESAPAGLSDEAQREAFEERAAIMEFDGGMTRAGAEAAARELLADGEVSARVARACTGCQHFGRHRTCLEPVAAGLLNMAEGFGIVWPLAGHAITCPSYTDKEPSKAQERPHKLSQAGADTCHAGGWDDAEISRFQARTAALRRRGITGDVADDLATRLTLRDREQDERVLCMECRHYRPGRCGNHKAAGLASFEVGSDLSTMLQRCPGFQVEGVTT